MRFRKKPAVIEAVKWDNREETLRALFDLGLRNFSFRTNDTPGECGFLKIDTLEGTMLASTGDWIIKGVGGEFYPCKPDIFAATYEPVEDSPR